MEKICTECCYGARYTCTFMQDRMLDVGEELPMPPPPRLRRVLNEWRWVQAEEDLEKDSDLNEIVVQEGRSYIFKLVRRDGNMWRVYGDDACTTCKRVDIQYPEFEALYADVGFMCGECAKQLSTQEDK